MKRPVAIERGNVYALRVALVEAIESVEVILRSGLPPVGNRSRYEQELARKWKQRLTLWQDVLKSIGGRPRSATCAQEILR